MKFFPGCMIHNRYPGIEKSIYYVFSVLGIEISPLEGSSCCPAPSITKSVSEEMWREIAERNLNLSNETIMTACNGCFTTLLEVGSEIGKDVRHFAEFLYRDVGIEEIRKKVSKKLNLRLAAHYGCHFFRPAEKKGVDSAERPKILDELIKAIGAESVNYRTKNMCCGGGGGVRAAATEVARELLEMKLEGLKEAEVDAIVVICPLCLFQFDTGQKELEKEGKVFGIPAIHYAQLLAIAMGMDVDEAGFEAHEIITQELYEKLLMGES